MTSLNAQAERSAPCTRVYCPVAQVPSEASELLGTAHPMDKPLASLAISMFDGTFLASGAAVGALSPCATSGIGELTALPLDASLAPAVVRLSRVRAHLRLRAARGRVERA